MMNYYFINCFIFLCNVNFYYIHMYLLNYILFFPAYQLDVTEIQTHSAGFASVA